MATLLMARRKVHLPHRQVGLHLHFADGTVGRVYRETSRDGVCATEPCYLAVAFRLKVIRGLGHRLFEVESMLHVPLFVGFPGFVSKLWLAADEHGVYRGLYDWDRPVLAGNYARALWRVLAMVSVPGTIRYVVLPGIHRDDMLTDAAIMRQLATGQSRAWWLVTETD